MELIPSGTKFDFMRRGIYAVTFSLCMIAASIYLFIAQGNSKFGIDFLGGHEIIVKFNDDAKVTSDALRSSLSKHGIENSVVQAFEADSNEYSIRLSGEDDNSKAVIGAITEAFNAAEYKDKFKIERTEFVGPTVGKELQRNALVAVGLGLIGILGYVTYRFEFAFALGAVAALFHDVIVSVGVYLLCGLTLNMASLAAALTIVGYSVNDTIIVFDRMREEMLRRKDFDLTDMMNASINSTLSRTVITSLLTLFSAAALLVYGGGAIAELSLFLVVGIITGTYSTIFIASPIAFWWARFRSPVGEVATAE